MKFLLLTDTHYGVRKNNINFYDYQKNFIENIFIPLIAKNKFDAIIHLGDLVDDRNSINYRTHDRMQSDFLDFMETLKIPTYWIVGNHDIFYKNKLTTNAIEKFVKCGEIITSPKKITINNEDFSFVPWICKDNEEETKHFLRNTITRYCFGHLELNGFEVRRGTLHKDGMSRELFQNFQSVMTGHFHNRSHGNNIRYIGSCFQFDWSDHDEYKGIAVLDTDTNVIKYLKNPYKMFNIKEYYESNIPDISDIKNSYVRVLVKEKKSETKLNDFISQIQDIGVIDCTTIDQTIEKIDMSDENLVVDDFVESCHNYISSLDVSNKDSIKELFDNLYQISLGA